MSEIPDDIKQAAITAWNESTRMSIRRQGDPWEPIARALMAERLAERERCAKVAEGRAYAHWKPVVGRRTDEQVELDDALREEADEIATAIRGQS